MERVIYGMALGPVLCSGSAAACSGERGPPDGSRSRTPPPDDCHDREIEQDGAAPGHGGKFYPRRIASEARRPQTSMISASLAFSAASIAATCSSVTFCSRSSARWTSSCPVSPFFSASLR